MKIEYKPVIDAFDQLLALADGLIETARNGDDGFLESMMDQRDDMKKVVLAFRSEHLTKEETKAIVGKYDFIKEGQRVIDNGQHDTQGQMKPSEVTNFVKYLCYNYLKKTLREHPIDPSMDEFAVRTHIDCLCIDWPKYKGYEKGFQHTMFDVVCLVTDEVMEHRKHNSQLELL